MPAASSGSVRCSQRRPRLELTGEALGGKVLEVFLPALLFLFANLAQILPDIESGVVAVGKHDAHGVVADGLKPRDPDIPLASHGEPLLGAVALYLGAWREHAQELSRNREALAIVETHGEDAFVLVEPELSRPRFWHVRGHRPKANRDRSRPRLRG